MNNHKQPRTILFLLLAGVIATLLGCNGLSDLPTGSLGEVQITIPTTPGRVPSDILAQVSYFPGGGTGAGCPDGCVSGAFSGNQLDFFNFSPNRQLRIIVYALQENPVTGEGTATFLGEWQVQVDGNGELTVTLTNMDMANLGIVVLDQRSGTEIFINRNMTIK